MLTVSLVFEHRNDQDELTDYQRIELDTDAALYLAQTMVGDDEWFLPWRTRDLTCAALSSTSSTPTYRRR
jgi:hypothetical protein